jgi:hypothetical protein
MEVWQQNDKYTPSVVCRLLRDIQISKAVTS